MSFVYKTFLIFIFIFYFSSDIQAAIGPGELVELEEKVYYNITPEKPNFGETVKLEALMYGTPVKDADFIWKMKGKIIKQGVGSNKMDFTLSEKTKIELLITTNAGVIVEKSFEFDPKKIIIMWESRTFVPPFYKGKSFYSPESTIILNAINLDQTNPLTNTYNNYTWSVDTVVKGDLSGVGYSSFLYQGDLLKREPLIKVSVAGISSFKDVQNNKSSSFNNESSIRVPTFPTEIITYEKSPLLGVLLNKTIKPNFKLDKSETTVVSYPLHYGLSSSLSGLYSWFINDAQINTTLNELSFKKKKDNEKSLLTIKIKNNESILQTRDVSYIIDTNK